MSNMRYASPKKSGKGGKGFFVALGVCLIAVGAAAFLTYQNVSQYFSPEQSASSQQPESKAESTQQAGNTVSGVKGDRQQRLLQRGGVLCGGIRA